MSEEQLKAFLEAVKADTGLQEKLKGATDSDSVMAIAKEAGSVTARKDDAPAAIQAAFVNVAELSSVSGGGGLIHTTSG